MKIFTILIILILAFFALKGCESPTIQEGIDSIEDTVKDTLGRIQIDVSLAECTTDVDCESGEECADGKCV